MINVLQPGIQNQYSDQYPYYPRYYPPYEVLAIPTHIERNGRSYPLSESQMDNGGFPMRGSYNQHFGEDLKWWQMRKKAQRRKAAKQGTSAPSADSQMLSRIQSGVKGRAAKRQMGQNKENRIARRTGMQTWAQGFANQMQTPDQQSINLLGSPIISQSWASATQIVSQKQSLLQNLPPRRTNLFTNQARVEAASFGPITQGMTMISQQTGQNKEVAKLEEKNNLLLWGGIGLASLAVIGTTIVIVTKNKNAGNKNYHF